jgi:hypothetical protein
MSWFKRSEKGIQTKTEEKKTFLKDCGTKHRLVKSLKPKSWPPTFMFHQRMTTMST